ncbi:MAG: alpha/beta hydrolase [Sneathiella sp.]
MMTYPDHAYGEVPPAETFYIDQPMVEGLKIFIRHRPAVRKQYSIPILFVHGATFSSPIFDSVTADANWMYWAAQRGFPAYALDIRGYGYSRSAAMREMKKPFCQSEEAIQDIDLAVQEICKRENTSSVHLIGGSWGSITTSKYAGGAGKDKVRSLLLYAPLYGAYNPAWIDMIGDPMSLEAYRKMDAVSLKSRWDEEIRFDDPATWRDDIVMNGLMAESANACQSSNNDGTPSFLAPNGTLLDLWEVFNGRPIIDPSSIECPVMLIRGDSDTTSTRGDALNLFDQLSSIHRRYVEIYQGTHYANLEKIAWQIFSESLEFFAQVESRSPK